MPEYKSALLNTIDAIRAAYLIDPFTLPMCPECKKKLVYIRPTGNGQRVFYCPHCKQEHIL